MTRRLLEEINLKPDNWEYKRTNNDGRALFWRSSDTASAILEDRDNVRLIKPRYSVGEVVYVKEAATIYDDTTDWRVCYKDNSNPLVTPPDEWIGKHVDFYLVPYTARTLPAWAARIFIDFLDVRPERLQKITAEDAMKEGCWVGLANALVWYRNLWDSINPKHPWASNPWVWRYEFRRGERP